MRQPDALRKLGSSPIPQLPWCKEPPRQGQSVWEWRLVGRGRARAVAAHFLKAPCRPHATRQNKAQEGRAKTTRVPNFCVFFFNNMKLPRGKASASGRKGGGGVAARALRQDIPFKRRPARQQQAKTEPKKGRDHDNKTATATATTTTARTTTAARQAIAAASATATTTTHRQGKRHLQRLPGCALCYRATPRRQRCVLLGVLAVVKCSICLCRERNNESDRSTEALGK